MTEVLSQLRRDPWFAAQSDALQNLICDRGVIVHRRDQQRIFSAGDGPDGLYAILHGNVHMMHLTPGGACGIYYVMQAPAWFGELSEVDGGPRVQDAIAVGKAKLFSLPHHAFRSIVDSDPRHWVVFASLMAQHIRDLFLQLEALTTRSARARLAGALLNIDAGARLAASASPFPDITQEALAMMIGVTRQTASTILREFEQNEIIRLGYRRLEILNRTGIQRIAVGAQRP